MCKISSVGTVQYNSSERRNKVEKNAKKPRKQFNYMITFLNFFFSLGGTCPLFIDFSKMDLFSGDSGDS